MVFLFPLHLDPSAPLNNVRDTGLWSSFKCWSSFPKIEPLQSKPSKISTFHLYLKILIGTEIFKVQDLE